MIYVGRGGWVLFDAGWCVAHMGHLMSGLCGLMCGLRGLTSVYCGMRLVYVDGCVFFGSMHGLRVLVVLLPILRGSLRV